MTQPTPRKADEDKHISRRISMHPVNMQALVDLARRKGMAVSECINYLRMQYEERESK